MYRGVTGGAQNVQRGLSRPGAGLQQKGCLLRSAKPSSPCSVDSHSAVFLLIRNPRTFSDRINWRGRALKDRRQELAWTRDEVGRAGSRRQLNASARAIAGDLDLVRIDLCEVEGGIWFGETAAYPCWGTVAFRPSAIDSEWGRLWELPEL